MSAGNTGNRKNELGLEYLVKGPPALVKKWNQNCDRLARLWPRASADIVPIYNDGGVQFRLNQAPSNSRNVSPAEPKTFFVTADNSDPDDPAVFISPGVINNVILPLAFQSLDELDDGDIVFLHATFDGAGNAIDLDAGADSSIPDNTTTDAYIALATVAVDSETNAVTVSPLTWNWAQCKLCGYPGQSTTYNWGGF